MNSYCLKYCARFYTMEIYRNYFPQGIFSLMGETEIKW